MAVQYEVIQKINTEIFLALNMNSIHMIYEEMQWMILKTMIYIEKYYVQNTSKMHKQFSPSEPLAFRINLHTCLNYSVGEFLLSTFSSPPDLLLHLIIYISEYS